jgi:hypothetical protein
LIAPVVDLPRRIVCVNFNIQLFVGGVAKVRDELLNNALLRPTGSLHEIGRLSGVVHAVKSDCEG